MKNRKSRFILLGSYFLYIDLFFDKTHFTCEWEDLSWV